jgi:hypothetical protein
MFSEIQLRTYVFKTIYSRSSENKPIFPRSSENKTIFPRSSQNKTIFPGSSEKVISINEFQQAENYQVLHIPGITWTPSTSTPTFRCGRPWRQRTLR